MGHSVGDPLFDLRKKNILQLFFADTEYVYDEGYPTVEDLVMTDKSDETLKEILGSTLLAASRVDNPFAIC